MDALGSAIRIDTRGREVMRILPRVNDDVNEEWISRQDAPRRRRPAHAAARSALCARAADKLRPADLDRSLRRDRAKTCAAQSPNASAPWSAISPRSRRCFALKDLMARLGVGNLDCRQDGAALDPNGAAPVICSTRPSPASTTADALLMVGSNPRREAAVLNARIRKRWRTARNFSIGVIGPKAPLTYPYDYLGAGPETLADIARHSFADTLRKAERPMVHRRRGCVAAAGRRGGRWRSRRKARSSSASSRTAGTVSACCTTRRRASARSISASCRARAA